MSKCKYCGGLGKHVCVEKKKRELKAIEYILSQRVVTTREVVEASGLIAKHTRDLLWKLEKEGKVKVIGVGVWEVMKFV